MKKNIEEYKPNEQSRKSFMKPEFFFWTQAIIKCQLADVREYYVRKEMESLTHTDKNDGSENLSAAATRISHVRTTTNLV